MCACVVSTPALLLLLLLLPKLSEKGNAILNKRRRRKEPASGATDFVRNSSEISGTSLALCVCLRWVASREKATIRGTDIPVELFRRAKDQNVAEEKLVLKSSSKKKESLQAKEVFVCHTEREGVFVCVFWCSVQVHPPQQDRRIRSGIYYAGRIGQSLQINSTSTESLNLIITHPRYIRMITKKLAN